MPSPPTKKSYDCPRCGKKGGLVKSGKTPSGRQRWKCRPGAAPRVVCYGTTDPDKPVPRDQAGRDTRSKKTPVFKRTLGEKTHVFVITAAQNATPIHEGFLAALKKYCEVRSAALMVIPLRYKNPTSRWTQSQANDEVWAPEVAPYLWNVRKRLNRNIVVLGDIKTQPTAINPLTGYESLTGGESGILGHTKLALQTIAAPQGRWPKILTTTGAVTMPNYTDSKAGKLGEFHHTLGAVVVEVRGKTFHMRQLGAGNTGTFYDLDQFYTGVHAGAAVAPPALALVMGDTHHAVRSRTVERALFEEIVPMLKPRNLYWHDLADAITVNHHNWNNPFVQQAKVLTDNFKVRKEFDEALEYVGEMTPAGCSSFIVPSNHNDWLHRWILERDWRQLPVANRGFYLELAAALHAATDGLSVDDAERLDAFILYAKKFFTGSKIVKVLEYDESSMQGEIECGMHGHLGPNGSRGTLRNLRRIGVKSVTGHEHSPGIDEGAWRVGTGTDLRRGYNRGPSGWLQTECAIYPNSKRTLINIINGEWHHD